MTKVCTKRKAEKDVGEFYRDSTKPDGRRPDCKKCLDNSQSKMGQLYKQTHRSEIALSAKNCIYKKKYGITLDQYNKMVAEQNGVCAICGQPENIKGTTINPRGLAVDHNHNTGKIRGLLCGRCNRAVGLIKDRWEIAQNMMYYLKRTNNVANQ